MNTSYGTPAPHALLSSAKQVPRSLGQRKGRLNYPALLASIFFPWLLFYIVCWMMSFYVHYERPMICWFVVFCGAMAVLLCAGLARQAVKKKRMGENTREPTWFVFMAATMFAAWLLGLVSGGWIYYGGMKAYYDLSNLATYPGVDPASYQGQQLMDAGSIMFNEGTKLDITLSSGFKSKEMYCVAPIVSGNPTVTRMASYDFWAIGKNCCSSSEPDFACGNYKSPTARGGIRLMSDGDRALYGLAVQQSVSGNGIQARMPLFFHWVEDPLAEAKVPQQLGFKRFSLWTMVYFALQLILAVTAALAFVRHGFGYA